MAMRPEQPYRFLRSLVGTAVIFAVVGLWIHARLYGSPLGTLWEVVMLLLVVASGYAVFGRETMTHAVEDAQEIRDGESEDSNDDDEV